jgi:phospholipase/lecithinase/hemolysin
MNTRGFRICYLLLFISLILPSLATADKANGGIIIFGDSLSDTGNRYYETGVATTPPYSELLDYFLVPDGPYTRGGLNFSNGGPWIEQLARSTGQSGYVGPALRNQGKASNYAYGGARAQSDIEIIENSNQHLPEQVTNFLADVNYSAPSDALYIIFIGGNDIFDAMIAPIFVPIEDISDNIILLAFQSVVTQIMTLKAHGAEKFLILNAPDLGKTPAVKIAAATFSPQDPNYLIGEATRLSMFYNSLLHTYLYDVPGIEIIDIYVELDKIISNPDDYGISNTTDPCVMPEQPPYTCKNPDGYVFWDGIHPTKKVHAIIAEKVAAALAD